MFLFQNIINQIIDKCIKYICKFNGHTDDLTFKTVEVDICSSRRGGNFLLCRLFSLPNDDNGAETGRFCCTPWRLNHSKFA